jgi:hypothetical protein
LAPAFMALKHLWDTQLGPTLNQFVGKFRDEIVPKVREGARLVGDVLTVAMIFLAAIINSIIIPALLRLQEWYKKNENEIKRVGTALGFLVKWFLLVAAIIMGVVVVALALGLGGALTTAGALITFLSGRIRDIINVFRILWGVVQATIGHFSGLSAAARTTAGMIVGAFTSLPGRLYGIGVNAIRSMISGFFSQSGALQNAAASVARAAVAGAMGALRIGSPSKIFRDMGQNTVKSMALGLMDMKADLAATAADVFSLQNYVPNGQMSLGRVALGGGQGGALMPSNVRTFDQTINVSTNEIDPRRNAIELGWELEGRLR